MSTFLPEVKSNYYCYFSSLRSYPLRWAITLKINDNYVVHFLSRFCTILYARQLKFFALNQYHAQ